MLAVPSAVPDSPAERLFTTAVPLKYNLKGLHPAKECSP